jgi:hypothetical protein
LRIAYQAEETVDMTSSEEVTNASCYSSQIDDVDDHHSHRKYIYGEYAYHHDGFISTTVAVGSDVPIFTHQKPELLVDSAQSSIGDSRHHNEEYSARNLPAVLTPGEVGRGVSEDLSRPSSLSIAEQWDILLKQFEIDWEQRQRLCRRRTGMREKNAQVFKPSHSWTNMPFLHDLEFVHISV